eukprot:6175246-Pleurochrysis_carterae.AAC.1
MEKGREERDESSRSPSLPECARVRARALAIVLIRVRAYIDTCRCLLESTNASLEFAAAARPRMITRLFSLMLLLD